MVRETNEFNRPEPGDNPERVRPFVEMRMDGAEHVAGAFPEEIDDTPDAVVIAREWLDEIAILVRRYDDMMAELEARATAEVDDWTERCWIWLTRNRMKYSEWRLQAGKDVRDLNERLQAWGDSTRSRAGSLQVRQRVHTAWDTSRTAREQRRAAARKQTQEQQVEEPMPARPRIVVDPSVEQSEPRVSSPEMEPQPAPVPLRDQALTAWQAALDQRAANQAARQRELDAREARALQRLVQERLGIRLQPTNGLVEIEGIRFAVRWSEQARTYELIVVEACRSCGKPAPSEDIRSLADLGAVLDREQGPEHLCTECRYQHQPVQEPSAAERLVDVMRALVAEEMVRERASAPAPHSQPDGRLRQGRPEASRGRNG